jgi:hypothetical protein
MISFSMPEGNQAHHIAWTGVLGLPHRTDYLTDYLIDIQ